MPINTSASMTPTLPEIPPGFFVQSPGINPALSDCRPRSAIKFAGFAPASRDVLSAPALIAFSTTGTMRRDVTKS
jgi:hypothetical protein